MAGYRDDDDDRGGFWLLLLLFLLLLIAAFFLWRWWSGNAQDDVVVETPAATSEADLAEPVVVDEIAAIDDPAEPIEAAPDILQDSFVEPPIEDVVDIPDNIAFTVNFELMKWNLTETAAATIDSVVSTIDYTLVTGVSVDGYTDTAGAESYNDALSERRAAVVRRYLIDNGAPAQLITATAHGETNLIVQTDNGVREGANRRVEVEIRFD